MMTDAERKTLRKFYDKVETLLDALDELDYTNNIDAEMEDACTNVVDMMPKVWNTLYVKPQNQ